MTRRRYLLAAGALAALVAIAFATGLLPSPDVEGMIVDVGRGLGKWTYLLVGGLAFLETGAFIGLIAPGETAIIVGGVVAGQGEIDPFVLTGIVWLCALGGDLTSYGLGRRLGRGFLMRHGPKLRITEDRLREVEGFFDRHGGPTILIGRFVGLVRALAPFVAGSARMPLRTFLPYDVIGCGLWASVFVWLGYVFWRSIGTVTQYAGRGAFVIGAIAALAAGVVWLRRRAPDHGPLRWLLDRITPGELGLEATTLAAVVLGGGFAFFALGTQVDVTPQLPGDRMAFDAFDVMRAGWLDDATTIATDLGSFAVVAPLTLLTAAYVTSRGRLIDALALIAGLVLAVICVDIAKEGFERPRPLQPIAAARGLAYPSGHTSNATALVACAVVLVRAGASVPLRISAVTLALILVAFVAATRVYLRVHYLSDVLGGAALGLACFAACGLGALVVTHVRHNHRLET